MIPPNVSAATLLAIQNTISRYCLALDTRDFSILKDVFTTDLQADYSAVSPQNKDIRGLDSMIDRLMVILEGKVTQHALTTQILEFENLSGHTGGYECKAMTYFTANTFVDKNRTREGLDHVTVFGRYKDSIIEVTPGQWRIRSRVVKTFVSLGCATLDFGVNAKSSADFCQCSILVSAISRRYRERAATCEDAVEEGKSGEADAFEETGFKDGAAADGGSVG
jgi:hypothetical protein